ncbi:DUF480 domain-containing protein [Egicoccus halophilus]|uniref:DUF480 domain-containing protein n=1 Tax=Egicoccus halophilus TaxID=1670830 RepID=UPI0013EECA6E|nr:DUF480 domain-containing protein [Egicoccus halophilus]
MQLGAQGQRVLGCLVEKALATPDHYPLSHNALRSACNQTTGRDPVVDYDDRDVRAGLDDLKAQQLVRSEYARGSRVPKAAHRLEEQLDLDRPQQAVLALLLLRGAQTPGELRSRAGRLHPFASVEAVEEVLRSLAEHRFGTLVERRAREPGRREARWAHLLGESESATAVPPDAASTTAASTSVAPTTDGPVPTAGPRGRHRTFADAVAAGDLHTAVAQLADDVVFHSPAVHRPYRGREATAAVLRAVTTVFEDFRYVDELDAGDRVGLVFAARVGDRELEGWDYLRFDEAGRIVELTVMIRPLSGLEAVVERMRTALGG